MNDELGSFDHDFRPAEREGTFRPGLETLSDGVYTFEILSAELTRTQVKQQLILRLDLKVLTPGAHLGQCVERVYFFERSEGVSHLGADLCILGIDADQWRPPDRPFSKELPLAVGKLRGICFSGKKVLNKGYHNLYVNSRVASDTGNTAPYTAPTKGSMFPPGGPGEEVPF